MKHVRWRRSFAIVIAPMIVAAAVSAQQSAPASGQAVRPCGAGALDPSCGQLGTPRLSLPDSPIVLETAEQPKIRVVALTRTLVHPWGLAFLPDGSLLVTERPGRLRMIRNGQLEPAPIAGVPSVHAVGLNGLM